jgi:hypothetical protein
MSDTDLGSNIIAETVAKIDAIMSKQESQEANLKQIAEKLEGDLIPRLSTLEKTSVDKRSTKEYRHSLIVQVNKLRTENPECKQYVISRQTDMESAPIFAIVEETDKGLSNEEIMQIGEIKAGRGKGKGKGKGKGRSLHHAHLYAPLPSAGQRAKGKAKGWGNPHLFAFPRGGY